MYSFRFYHQKTVGSTIIFALTKRARLFLSDMDMHKSTCSTSLLEDVCPGEYNNVIIDQFIWFTEYVILFAKY